MEELVNPLDKEERGILPGVMTMQDPRFDPDSARVLRQFTNIPFVETDPETLPDPTLEGEERIYFDGSNYTYKVFVNGGWQSILLGSSAVQDANFFGDGSDGAVTISADTTLSRDMYYDTLVVNSGKTLNPGGFRIFAKTSVTVTGTIARNGAAGANGTSGSSGASTGGNGGVAPAGGAGGAALADGTLSGTPAAPTGGAGGLGSTGASNTGGSGGTPTAATAVTSGVGASASTDGKDGTAGGGGGSGGGGGGGAKGTAGAFTAANDAPRNVATGIQMVSTSTSSPTKFQGSALHGGSGGSGGGGGSNANNNYGGQGGASGGNGSNGGIVLIASPLITISAGGIISATGGNGGAGGNGGNGTCGSPGAAGAGSGSGGSGGMGGCGGVLVLIYRTLTNNGGQILVTGGLGGQRGTQGTACGVGSTNGNVGTNGSDGATGNIYYITTT